MFVFSLPIVQLDGHVEEDPNPGAVASEYGAVHLFFGCRHPEQDYLYREEIEHYVATGALSDLHLAFSRVNDAPKVYVQHRIEEADTASALAELIVEHGAYVFVCGDGAHMAKDVHAALCRVLVKHGGIPEAEVEKYMMELLQRKRYIRDIWS